jgi:hypothetical protein
VFWQVVWACADHDVALSFFRKDPQLGEEEFDRLAGSLVWM